MKLWQLKWRKVTISALKPKLRKASSLLQLSTEEEQLLHAAEYGDIPTVKRILEQNSELKVSQ